MTHLLTETWLLVKPLATLAIVGIVLPFVYNKIEQQQQELKTQKVTTKTKNLSLALEFAKGAVTFAERFATSGETQQLQAVNNLKNRLKENGLEANFTETQIKQIIQNAYAQAKANGLIDAVKKDA